VHRVIKPIIDWLVFMNKSIGYLIGIVAIIAIVLIVVSVSAPNKGVSTSTVLSSTGAVSTPVLLTDPPQVPNGTSALVVSYSSLAVHTSGTSTSGWINAQGSGSVNLMNITNTSQIIGTANLSANTTINMVRFAVTSASITINGVTSNVTVPSGYITAQVTGNQKVNASTGALLDFTPTVATIFTANSTLFVLVPSVRAVLVGNQSVSASTHIGAHVQLMESDRVSLEAARPNVSVVASSLSVSGNTTTLSVTVKDNSNMSVDLRHLLLYGNQSVFVIPENSLNATVHINASDESSVGNGIGVGVNAGVGVGAGIGSSSGNGSDHGNGSGNAPSNTVGEGSGSSSSGENAISHANESEHETLSVGLEAEQLREFAFQIAQNGTLTLPSLNSESEQESNGGYNMTAGSTATFTFTGVISEGEGHIVIAPTPGSVYRLVVSGEQGARASTNITAS
jgi:hypothetical protein